MMLKPDLHPDPPKILKSDPKPTIFKELNSDLTKTPGFGSATLCKSRL